MDKRFQMNSSNQMLDDIHIPESQLPPVPASSVGGEYHDDDREYMDRVLENIDQMLMEEGDMDEQQTRTLQESLDFQAKERSFYELLLCPDDVVDPSSHRATNVVDRQINDEHGEIDQVVWNFQKGVDDANKLLQRGKKKPPADLEDGETRSRRLPAVYAESSNVPMEIFDDVLLSTEFDLEKHFGDCTLHLKGPDGNKTKGGRLGSRNQNEKKEVIDFRSLLVSCAQSIAADDRGAADGFLRQIREHSSPLGDGEQRLAHYFANALEARLAGTGTQMQQSLFIKKRTPASDYLGAYHAYIVLSPFVRISTFVSNKTICIRSAKANAVHIIDFGILYGFQWPNFIQHLAQREGGPPSLKITGIDFPQPGFRPAETVEETGRRLARYAEKFNVPFEYKAITQSWESIKIEDLKIEKGEFVAVNCLYRADNLLDEAGVGEESPRNTVLHLIRKIKPDCFVHGVVSASNGLPFFASRFREVLFHYSALYDMMETTIHRANPERAMLESEIFGKEALNAIACENRERLGRTEHYKQWGSHHLRAGFVQFPFERKLMGRATKMVRNIYHRDFLIDEDKDWLLMGWKGRILYAVSCWQPISKNRVR